MIFKETAQWVLDRSPHTGEPKTQTRRPARDGDCFRDLPSPRAVFRRGRLLWEVGKVYSIQTGRGVKGTGHFRLLGIRFEKHTGDISAADARAEGFATPDAFREIWAKLYGRAALERPCYALTIECMR